MLIKDDGGDRKRTTCTRYCVMLLNITMSRVRKPGIVPQVVRRDSQPASSGCWLETKPYKSVFAVHRDLRQRLTGSSGLSLTPHCRGSLSKTPLWRRDLSRRSGRPDLINRLVMRVGVACYSRRG